MAGAIVAPEMTGWQHLLQQLGLGSGPRRRSPLALRGDQRAAHAEIFMSERTGEWIRVGCDCRVGYDHWHTGH
ncbi:hypothetical protein GCM10022286_14460 [Gryllotalpicola daejeonensis]|uniref:Uncharacterized protein n=1 Tax=Gryllotalpicola daejeonensis TaxID=993087 RepID=A0ABP7ZJ36_9MICO